MSNPLIRPAHNDRPSRVFYYPRSNQFSLEEQNVENIVGYEENGHLIVGNFVHLEEILGKSHRNMGVFGMIGISNRDQYILVS